MARIRKLRVGSAGDKPVSALQTDRTRATIESSFRDPVCGMEVSRTTAVEEFVYQGKTYYFCARICRQAFEAEPEKYIRAHRQRGMKPR